MGQREDWDRRAQRYDGLQWVHNDSLLDWIANIVWNSLGDQCNLIVEPGCGTGALTCFLPLMPVLAYDVSPEMVERARVRVEEDGGVRKELVTLAVADDVTIEHEPAQAIVSRMVLHHADDPRLAILRWASRLAPGGVLIVAEGPPPVHDPMHPAWWFYSSVMREKEPGRHVFSAADIAQWMIDAGCVEVQVHETFTEGNSLRNWLGRSMPDSDGQAKEDVAAHLEALHVAAARARGTDLRAVADAYRMRLTPDGDVLMRWRHCVVVGYLPSPTEAP